MSKFFARLRKRIGLDHLDFHYLRKFMETYGQEMGYSVAAGVDARRPRPGHRGEALQQQGERDRPSTRDSGGFASGSRTIVMGGVDGTDVGRLGAIGADERAPR